MRRHKKHSKGERAIHELTVDYGNFAIDLVTTILVAQLRRDIRTCHEIIIFQMDQRLIII